MSKYEQVEVFVWLSLGDFFQDLYISPVLEPVPRCFSYPQLDPSFHIILAGKSGSDILANVTGS